MDGDRWDQWLFSVSSERHRNVGRTKLPIFRKCSSWDSNPGSFDGESGSLTAEPPCDVFVWMHGVSVLPVNDVAFVTSDYTIKHKLLQFLQTLGVL